MSPKIHPSAYSYDPELPGSARSSTPTSVVKRLFARRARLILVATLSVGAFVYLSGPPAGGPPHGRRPPSPHDDRLPDRLDEIWEDDGAGGDQWGAYDDDTDDGAVWSEGNADSDAYVVDEYGDHFYPNRLQKGLAPRDPRQRDLADPDTLFPEVDLETWFRPPTFDPYPDSELDEIISEEDVEHDEPQGAFRISDEAFSRTWVGREDWNSQPRGVVRRVQWEGFDSHTEPASRKQLRGKRREAVRRGFAYAWQAYKDHAWGHDELKPVSLQPSDPFNNWGASIVDSLDTLLAMGFSDEYDLCRPHVNQLNFHWVNGRDWSRGFISQDLIDSGRNDPDEPAQAWAMLRDRAVGLPVFETGIRYLGGLLGAHDLSGDTLMLERAVDLAHVLGRAFETESGLPAGRIDPGKADEGYRLSTVSAAEVGSMTLELMRLGQLTGDRKWHDLAQRAMDYLEQRVIPRGQHKPLLPMWFQPDHALNQPMHGGLTFGGLADSYYEYLIKTYKLLGATPAAQQYADIYARSIDAAKELLYVEVGIVPGVPILALGKLENGRLIPEIEHLTSFAGAMLGLGARLLPNREQDMRDAERFTQSCYWLSASTPTGLQPEVVEFFPPDDPLRMDNVTFQQRPHHPYIAHEPYQIDFALMHRDRENVLRWNRDDMPVLPQDGGRSDPSPVQYRSEIRGVPPGVKKVSARGINRPENIESVFYMYRLTGDTKWQDKGWQMFVSWTNAAKVAGGVSSIEDVTKLPIKHTDNMESFAFAETFKGNVHRYHLLLQSEPDLLSLDDYVLNTEAHPFIATPDLVPGGSRLHRTLTKSQKQKLGVRGQGTHAQKWKRFEMIRQAKEPYVQRKGGAGGGGRVGTGTGGKGMGGGGGDPNYRPKPPLLPGKVWN